MRGVDPRFVSSLKDISLIAFNSYCRKVSQLSQRPLRHLRSLDDPDLGNQGIIDVSGNS